MKKTVYKKISLLLAAILLFISIAVPVGAITVSDFTDVGKNDWYHSAVDYAVTENLFTGTSANTFSPNSPMTRAMFVTVLGRLAGMDASKYQSSSFYDVSAQEWYGPSVEWAYCNDVVNGIGNYRFSPEGRITREQIATVMYNFAEATGNSTVSTADVFQTFTDIGNVSSWARTPVQWATYNRVLNGYNGKLNPRGTATRAEVAQILYNCRSLFHSTALLNEQLPGSRPTPPPTPTPDPTPTPTPDPINSTVYWTPSGGKYHRQSCPTITGSRDIRSGSIYDAGKRSACKVCNP